MKVLNITQKQLEKALELTNKDYDDNLMFNRLEALNQKGTTYRMTIRVKNSSGKGAKIGYTGRKTISACWHAHGDLFDNILKLSPEAKIRTAGLDIDINGGNWIDKNIGSIINPMYFSEACNCD